MEKEIADKVFGPEFDFAEPVGRLPEGYSWYLVEEPGPNRSIGRVALPDFKEEYQAFKVESDE